MLIKDLIYIALFSLGTLHASSSFDLSKEELDNRFNATYSFYRANKTNLTTKAVGQIEFRLKPIVNGKHSSNMTLAKTAFILYTLGCKSTHQKAMHALFYRSDFDAPLYGQLNRDIYIYEHSGLSWVKR